MGYNWAIEAGLMLLLTAPAPMTPNLTWRPDAVAKTIQQLSLPTLTEGKTCPQCNQWKPLVKFLKGGYVGGRSPRCRICTDPPEKARARDRARYRKPNRNHSTKARVREWYRANRDYVQRYNREKYQTDKPLRAEYGRKYYLENKERHSAAAKVYRETHKDQLAAAKRRYYEANSDLIKEQHRQSYARNREKRLADCRAYRKAHPEVKQVAEARRYARMKGAKGKFGVRIWRQICAAYGPNCLKCKEHKPLTIDHVVPISKDGFDCVCNIQPLCLECNVNKNIRIVDYRPFLISISCPHREAA